MRTLNKLLMWSAGAALLLMPSIGGAETASAEVAYQLTLEGVCTVAVVGRDFGTYPVTQTTMTGMPAGSVTVNCSAGTAYDWGIDQGDHFLVQRHMYNTVGMKGIGYDLFPQGDGHGIGDDGLEQTDGAYVVTMPGVPSASRIIDGLPLFTGTGLPVQYNVEAAIYFNVGETYPPGLYTDTATVTVVW